MEAVKQQLKLYSRQYDLYMKPIVALQNNLISLADKTFPGVNELFSSPERVDQPPEVGRLCCAFLAL